MLYAILSILLLTLTIWLINKKSPIQICSICAGVTLTWLWMLSAMWLGFLRPVSEYEIIIAILMGASIGGIVTELKKLFTKLRNKSKSQGKEAKSSEQDRLKDCC